MARLLLLMLFTTSYTLAGSPNDVAKQYVSATNNEDWASVVSLYQHDYLLEAKTIYLDAITAMGEKAQSQVSAQFFDNLLFSDIVKLPPSEFYQFAVSDNKCNW